jgi:CelD/BcsL family acetyltransferase involved in cellulose biosynthesis
MLELVRSVRLRADEHGSTTLAGATPSTQTHDIDADIDGLLALRPERSVFLRPVWLRTWFGEFGGSREALLLGLNDGGPLAVAPLMREEGRLTFMGDSAVCDYMDFLTADGSDAAYADLWRRICAEEWDELELWGLPEPSPTRVHVRALAAADGYRALEDLEAVAPRVHLPDSWDGYLASLGKKDRHELRRKMRRLFESGARVDLDVYSRPEDVSREMEEFLRLHTVSRQDKADFMSGAMPSFFRRMAPALASAGLVRLFMLRVDEKSAASVLCFEAGCSLYMYNSGYDPEFSSFSVGLLSKALCIQWAIENGKETLDFLRGNEAYKYDLGATDQNIYRLVVRR